MSRPVIGGWALEEQLSQGGFGTVWRARGPRGEMAALKLLDRALDAEDLLRFRREVESLARLRHPGVVRVLDAGLEPARPWLAMELIRGESLQALLSRQGCLPPARALDLGIEVADALSAVHAAGLVHRDVKPENILLAAGRAVLVDLGLALPLWEERLTHTGEAMGTAAYMAPEQARGAAELGPAVDVYGLGATLYALVTGAPPFGLEPAAEVMARVQRDEPEPPSARAPGISPAFEALVLRCLAKRPGDRPPTAAALAALLRQARGAPAGPASAAPIAPGWVAAGLVAVALVLAVGGWLALHGGAALPLPPSGAPVTDPAVHPPEADGARRLVIQPGPRAGQDTWVQDVGLYVNDNYGASASLLVGSRARGQTGDFRSYLRFDLGGLPDGARLRSARLELKLRGTLSPPALRLRAWRVLGPWEEGSSTRDAGLDGLAWAGATPGGEFPARSSGRPDLDQPEVARDGSGPEGCVSEVEAGAASPERWLTLDVSEAAHAWQADPAGNWGLRLAHADEGPPWDDARVDFVSSDAPEAAERPRLVIEYDGPPPLEHAAAQREAERAGLAAARALLRELESAPPQPGDDGALERASRACREAPGWSRPYLVRAGIYLGRLDAVGKQDTTGAYSDVQLALGRALEESELELARRVILDVSAALAIDPRNHPGVRELLESITEPALRDDPQIRQQLERLR